MRATNLILIAISFCTLLNSCSEKDKKFEKLVWSDEFDYTGLPDSTKWTYEEGYVRNNEMQYYTRKSDNAWVEMET